jgi:hypothetical protein
MSIIILTDWAIFIKIVARNFELYIILGTKFLDSAGINLPVAATKKKLKRGPGPIPMVPMIYSNNYRNLATGMY